MVETQFVVNAHFVEDASAAKKFYEEKGALSAEDITATLVHLLSAPPHVQVSLQFSLNHLKGSVEALASVGPFLPFALSVQHLFPPSPMCYL